MTPVNRYAGRHGGPGVSDALSGPEIVAACFADDAAVQIDDPLSFPWHLVADEQWRQPVTVDLSGCSGEDLVALLEVLPVLTPEDRVIVDSTIRPRLLDRLSLPESAYVGVADDDPGGGFAARRPGKLRRALLREVLEPIVARELTAAEGGDEPRPLLAIEWGADDDWHGSFVPAPHRYERRSVDAAAIPRSAAIAIISEPTPAASTMAAALVALAPGGLVILVLDEHVVASAAPPSMSEVITMVDAATGGRRVVEHLWGLHPRPGAGTLGGVLAVRPLGGDA